MTNLIANIFTITVLSYWAGCAAFSFGWYLGWLVDPEQWPRFMVTLILDVLRWDREVTKVQKAMDEWFTVFDGGRAPRGTP